MGLVVGLLAAALRFPGAIPGPLVVSANDHLSVHPAFQTSQETGRVHHPHLSDPALQLSALDQQTVEELRAGRVPLWNPLLYGGAPLLGDAQSRPASPVTWLKVPTVYSPATAQDLGVVFLFSCIATGFACVAHAVLRRPTWPAVATAAAVAVTSPYLSVWLLHPHASTYVWLPLLLLAIETASAGGMMVATMGLLCGGHPGTIAHVALITAGWWLLRSRGGRVVIGGLVGVLLAAPVWMPIGEEVLRSTTATARIGGALDPAQLLDLVWPAWHGHPARETWNGPGSWADGQLHPGVGVVLLLPFTRGRLSTGILAGVALACGLSVTGLPGPIAHGRLGSLSMVLLALPVADAVHRLTRQWPRAARALPLVVVLTGTWARRDDQHTLDARDHTPEPAPWTAAIARGARVIGLGWAVQPNTGALLGWSDLRGYDLPVSVDTHRLMSALNPRPRGPWYPIDTPPSPTMLAWWGVDAMLAFPESHDAVASWARTSGWSPEAVDGPLEIWRPPEAPTRAWLATSAEVIRDPSQALRVVQAADRRPRPPVEREVAAVGGRPGVWPVTQTEDTPARMTFTWEPLDVPSVLVVSTAWAPGWRARRDDGTAIPPLRVGGASLGLALDPGVSGATLYFRPDSWIWGQRLGVAGVVAALGLWLLGRRRASLVSPPAAHSCSPSSQDPR